MSDATDDLRDQITGAIVNAAHVCQVTGCQCGPAERLRAPLTADGRTPSVVTGPPAEIADAAMTVVQPAIDRALQQGWQDMDEQVIKPERALHEQTIQRAEQAEALLRELADEPCSHPTSSPCAHDEAKAHLAAVRRAANDQPSKESD